MTLKPISQPIVIGSRFYSEHTMYPYKLTDGESPYSIENWPMLRLTKRASGWYTAQESSTDKISLPKTSKRQQYGYEEISVIGSSLTSLAFALTMRQKGIMGDIAIFTEQHDYLPYGFRRSESSRGTQNLLKTMDVRIIDCQILHGINTTRKYVLHIPVDEKEIPAYLVNQEGIRNIKHTYGQLVIAPNKQPAVPAGLEGQQNIINLELDMNAKEKLANLPQGHQIKALTSNLRHLESLTQAAAQNKSVKLFGSLPVDNNTEFYKWLKQDVLKGIQVQPAEQMKAEVSGSGGQAVTWAVDTTKINLDRYSHFVATRMEGLVCNTTGTSYSLDLGVGGPASLVPIASLAKYVPPLENLQVQLGKAAAHSFVGQEDCVNGVNVQCYQLASRNVCEVGEVDNNAKIWETGSPQKGNYLSIFTDKSGMIHGARSVGPFYQRRLGLIHEGLVSGKCFPKRADFYKQDKGWAQLEECVLRELEKNHNIFRGHPIHRR